MTIVDHTTWLVAKREITEGIRAKAFKILLGISAVAVAGLIVIFHFASNSSSETVTDLGIVGNSMADESGLDALGDAIGTRIDVVPLADDDAARAAVANGDVDAAVLAGAASILTNEHIDLDGDSTLAIVINVLRSDLALDEALGSAGLTPTDIEAVRGTEPPPVNSIEPDDDDGSRGRIGTAVAMNVLLFLLLQTYGGWVVTGVTREKSSRVVEVLLSTVTPRQLMLGKILGVGIVALIHASVLVVTALVTAQIVGLDVLDGFRPGDLAMGAIWFLLGYALYCCAFAAAGSLATRSEDAQGVTLPVMLPLIAGYIIGFSAAGGDANTLLWVLAFFPPTAVLCMPVLSATGAVAIWMVVLSMLITLAAAYLIGLLAARIYARSILKTGKRVSWREALSRKAAETA